MNASAALIAGGKTTDLKKAFEIASEAIDSGAAREKLEDIKRITNSI
jgi:anthranilate phosphoribosyltransferase